MSDVTVENGSADKRLQLLLQRYALAVRAHFEALESLDEARAEAQAKMLAGLHGALLREGPRGEELLLALIDCSDPVVAGMAAVHSLGRDTVRCLAVLRRIAAEPGLLGFRAGSAVQRWESGEWEA
jgi:hypothetical protein